MSEDIWPRFEVFLSKHAPNVLAALRPPATAEQIDAAERAVGQALPEDIRRAYLRHDGCAPAAREGSNLGLFPPHCWLACLEDVKRSLQMYRDEYLFLRSDPANHDCIFPEPDETWASLKARPIYYDPAWIPIGRSNSALSKTFVDLNPAPAGKRGQLLWDMGDMDHVWFADSLDAYLEKLIEATEAGKITHAGEWVWASNGQTVLDWTSLWR